MSMDPDETDPYPEQPAPDYPTVDPGAGEPDASYTEPPAAMTYDEAIARIDAMDTSPGSNTYAEGHVTTYDEAIAAINAMDMSPNRHVEPPPVDSADPYTASHPPLTYEETLAKIDDIAAGRDTDPAPALAGRKTSDDEVTPVADATAATDAHNVFDDVSIPTGHAVSPEMAAAFAPNDKDISLSLTGTEPPSGKDASSPPSSASAASAVEANSPAAPSVPDATPFDDLIASPSDTPAAVNDDPIVTETLLLRAGEGSPSAPTNDASSQRADGLPASQTVNEPPPDLQSTAGLPSIVPADGPSVAAPDSDTVDLADSISADPVSASTAEAPPTVTTADLDEYVDELHTMDSDRVLDEFSGQDQPELRQAALSELRTRLHSSGAAADAPPPPDFP